MKIRFHIHYHTEVGQNLRLLGSPETLGAFSLASAPYMFHDGDGYWHYDLELDDSSRPFPYRYLVVDERTGQQWGELFHPDRCCHPQENIALQEIHDSWRPPFRGAGIAIPVFSLRSEEGLGVGEFHDLLRFADFSAACGMKLIQLLPVNDTTAYRSNADALPYAAISVFALHPLYLHIPALGAFTPAEKKRYQDHCAEKNALPELDYLGVMTLKEKYLHHFYRKNGREILASEAFQTFFKNNRSWLKPYAAFCCLRDETGSCDSQQWGLYAQYSPSLLERYLADHPQSCGYYYYMQYHLHCQLQEASHYALSKGIRLKGDLPIGVMRYSVDVWVEPSLFLLDRQAGAPPDAFSTTGQNWAFPTYSWEAMAADNYRWWKRRLQKMEDYFQVLRIDHILGFFRIWSIPAHSVDALLGSFSPALPYSVEELNRAGLWLDRDRLCKPYIHEKHLRERFQKHHRWIAAHFFETRPDNRYDFLPAFSTQQAVRQEIQRLQKNGWPVGLSPQQAEWHLFRLLEEVLFLEDPCMADHYHPRIDLLSTASFQELDPYTQNVVYTLYLDFFYQRHNDFWAEAALEKLRVLSQNSKLMLCGEDLGMVPACVPGVMEKLALLRLLIQRMPSQSEDHFVDLSKAPYLSVCSPSTHDMDGLRAWWEKEAESRERYYREVLCETDPCPETCSGDIVRKIQDQHLQSPALWAIFPLQDFLASDERLRRLDPHEERINQPNKQEGSWRYRMHVDIEDLLKEKSFLEDWKERVNHAVRGK